MATLRLLVSSVCNFSCSFCHVYKITDLKQDKPFMEYEDMIRYVDSFIAIMQKNSDTHLKISIYGGEPLLNKKNVFDLIKKIGNYYNGITISWIFNTNGSLITEEDAQFFKAYNIDVHVSCDGKKEIHDINRIDKNNKETYEKVVNALLLLKKYDVNRQINSFVTPENIDSLRDIVDIALLYEIDRIYLDWFYTSDHNKIHPDTLVSAYIDVYSYAKRREVSISGPWGKTFFRFMNNQPLAYPKQKLTSNMEINTDSSFLFNAYPLVRNEHFSFDSLASFFSSKENYHFMKKQSVFVKNICASCPICKFCKGTSIQQYQYHVNKKEGYTYYCTVMKKTLKALANENKTKKAKTIHVNISYVCNKSCSYCYAKPLMERYEDMTPDDFEKLCKWLKRNDINSINFVGGEPTICPNLLAFLGIARKYKISVTIFSNGLFKTELIKSLKNKIKGFLINYNPRSHYSEEEWNRLHKNLDTLYKENIFFNLTFIVLDTFSSYEYALDICKKYKINKPMTNPAIPNSFKDNSHVSTEKLKIHLNHMLSFVKLFISNNIFIRFSRPIPPCLFSEDDYEYLKNNAVVHKTCNVGKRIVSINPDLSIFPCLSLFIKGPTITNFPDFDAYAKYYERSIKDMKWKKKLFLECEDCEYFKKKECQGSCLCRKSKEFSITDAKHFLLYSQYTNNNEYFIEDLKYAISTIETFIPIKKKIEIYQFDNREDFLIYSNVYEYPGWVTAIVNNGIYYQYEKKIHTKRLIHELVHCVLKDILLYRIPSWVNEGICEYIAFGDETTTKMRSLLKTKRIIPFSDMSGTYPMSLLAIDSSVPDRNLAYQQAGSMIGYICKKYSMEKLIEMLTDSSNDFYIAFKKYTGKEFYDFEKEWIKDII